MKASPRTPSLTDLFKQNQPKADKQEDQPEKKEDKDFTPDQLKAVWDEYANQRRNRQAEYQMLTQPYEIKGTQIVISLLSPVQETLLNNIKSDLTGFLRERLHNNSIQVTGTVQVNDDKKVIYTNREKFEYLAEKNPILKELKDRLGLDTDF